MYLAVYVAVEELFCEVVNIQSSVSCGANALVCVISNLASPSCEC